MIAVIWRDGNLFCSRQIHENSKSGFIQVSKTSPERATQAYQHYIAAIDINLTFIDDRRFNYFQFLSPVFQYGSELRLRDADDGASDIHETSFEILN